MLHIPVYRQGRTYESVEKTTLVHHATGDPLCTVSQANSGLIVRDIHRVNDRVLESFTTAELVARCRKAAELFMTAPLPLGDTTQTFDDYVAQLSATTGMPVSYCRNNARKIHRVLDEIEGVLAGLTRGLPWDVLDRGYGEHDGRMVSFFREGRVFGAILPSNSPGVHSLWIPAIVLKTPLILKPGREEPWSPWRIMQALIAAGIPGEAFGFYPTDHGGSSEILGACQRAMLFGDERTTRPWAADGRVELHGPGWSKVILDNAAAENFAPYVDLIASSIAANGGRSCINASGVWTPKNGRAIADALAEKLAGIEALPADDPNAQIAAFANPAVADAINAQIEHGLREGAVDLTRTRRGGDRLVKRGRVAYLLPTIVHVDSPQHPLANREFLFPFASVVECPQDEIPDAIGGTLIASAITSDRAFAAKLMAAGNIDRLNIGPIPTWQISWDQPHEGNLFEHLYRQRAFQIELAA